MFEKANSILDSRLIHRRERKATAAAIHSGKDKVRMLRFELRLQM